MIAPVALWPPPAAWPANILRFHLAFPLPMDGWRAMDHLALEAAGDTAPGTALLDLQDELWDPEQTVLTVLLHPGRVKRGVGALGTALRPGAAARLLLRATLTDATGEALGRDVTFGITVTPAVRAPIRLPDSITPGDARASVPLDLGRPFDLLGVTEGLRLADMAGRPVAHRAEPFARGVVLHPATTWPGGVLRLAASPWLEDACGNRADAAFEAPLTAFGRSSAASADCLEQGPESGRGCPDGRLRRVTRMTEPAPCHATSRS